MCGKIVWRMYNLITIKCYTKPYSIFLQRNGTYFLNKPHIYVCVCMYLLLNHIPLLCRTSPVHFVTLASQATRFMTLERGSDPAVSTGCQASWSGIFQWIRRTKLVQIWQNYRNTAETEEGNKSDDRKKCRIHRHKAFTGTEVFFSR